MCEPVSITTAVLGASSAVTNVKNQNKAWAATETARRKQNIEMVRQSNLQDANLMLQDKSNFEQARQALENQTLDAIKAQGTVNAAINESNMEGRTTERVRRDVENVALRTKGMINENYQRDYLNIYTQREANRDQLISVISNSAASPRPSTFGQILDVGMGTMQGASLGSDLNSIIESAPNSKLFGSNIESNRK